MIDLLAEQPLLLLFLVAAVGYPLGRIQVAGSRLGTASVLFVGLAIGALDPRLKLPDIIYLIGLVLFIYPIGVSSGPSFVAAFRRKGLRDNLLVLSVLALVGVLAAVLQAYLEFTPAMTTGLVAGGLTNTPALASILETLRDADPATSSAPVVGYSIAYPIGVLGMIGIMAVLQRLWKVDFRAEARQLEHLGATSKDIHSRTIDITRADAEREPIQFIAREEGWDVRFTRIQSGGHVDLIGPTTRVHVGDRITIVGTPDHLDRAEQWLGERSRVALEDDRTEIDFRRLVVSSRKVAGRRLQELGLLERFGSVVTRIRRGDVELLPFPEFVFEPGDRLRVVGPRKRLDEVSRFFGDSYRAISEVDVMSFSLGIFMGMLLGMVPIPLPGGITVSLGLAGGPLVVGIILGAMGFTGPMVWTMPYSANLTLRQIGLVLFFAGVGTRAGYSFYQTLQQPEGVMLFAGGAAITLFAGILLLFVGYKLLKIPLSLLGGMLAGMQTQPAVLSYASEQTGNDLPSIGYATVFPAATLAKIILVQVLLGVLG